MAGEIIQYPLREAIEREKEVLEEELKGVEGISIGSWIFERLVKATKGYDIDIMVKVEEEEEVTDRRQAEIDAGWL